MSENHHPRDCPGWEYEQHPERAALTGRIAKILARLGQGRVDTVAASRDGRPIHAECFVGLTPAGCDYFAGHYRGELLRCLEHYEVCVEGDPRVGYNSRTVHAAMGDLAQVIGEGLGVLDAAVQVPDAQVSAADKLLYVVAFACRVFELFLRVHPYANGNGHLGRFLIWFILRRYGYVPIRWTIDPRPAGPYADEIVRHRNGDPEPLEQLVLGSIARAKLSR